jgi:hypothetical protein
MQVTLPVGCCVGKVTALLSKLSKHDEFTSKL